MYNKKSVIKNAKIWYCSRVLYWLKRISIDRQIERINIGSPVYKNAGFDLFQILFLGKSLVQDILPFYFINIGKYKLLYLGYFSWHIDLPGLKLKLLL